VLVAVVPVGAVPVGVVVTEPWAPELFVAPELFGAGDLGFPPELFVAGADGVADAPPLLATGTPEASLLLVGTAATGVAPPLGVPVPVMPAGAVSGSAATAACTGCNMVALW